MWRQHYSCMCPEMFLMASVMTGSASFASTKSFHVYGMAWLHLVPSFLPPFLPSFCPSLPPSFLPCLLSHFLPCFLPSSLSSFLPSFFFHFFLTFFLAFLHSFLAFFPSFLFCFLPCTFLPSFSFPLLIFVGEVPCNHEIMRDTLSMCQRLPVMKTAQFREDFYDVSKPWINPNSREASRCYMRSFNRMSIWKAV